MTMVKKKWYQSHSAVWCECADEGVELPRGVDCNISHRPNGEGLCVVYVHAHIQSNMRLFGGSAASDGMGTPRLSMLMLE